jgi:hypothetical protein
MPPAAARRHLATWRPMRIRLWLGFALGVVAFAAASANGAPIVAIFTVAGTDKGGFAGDGGRAPARPIFHPSSCPESGA